MKQARTLSNIGIKGRLRQILILMGAILLGVVISCSVEAQDFHKAKKRHFKAKYRTQISQANKECTILSKKRNARHKTPLFAAHYRKPKYKPQAEVDTPGIGKNEPMVASNH